MRRWARRLAVVVAAIVAVAIGVRLALDPIATWRTRRALAGLHGMTARFASVSVSVRDLAYEIRGLRIDERGAGGRELPFFRARRIRLGLLWRDLLHGHLVGRAELDAPRLTLVQTPEAEARAGSQANPKEEIRATPTLAQKLSELTPFLLDRVQVRDGEIAWIDAHEPEKPVLRLREVEATLENFASRPALSRAEPTVLALRGTIQSSGRASLFATADPLAKQLTFAGQGRVDGLKLAELGPIVGSKTGVAPDHGTLDLRLRFQAEGGRLTGGIRPIIQGASTHASRSGLGAKLKSLLADLSLHIFKDEVPGRHAVATTIPIEGRLDDPNLQVVPTILGIVRNAFVRGVSDSLRGLPPPKAKKPQPALEQARRALSPGPRNQPRAQPQGKGK